MILWITDNKHGLISLFEPGIRAAELLATDLQNVTTESRHDPLNRLRWQVISVHRSLCKHLFNNL
ncbi:hypothetical protein CSX04_08052 [Burkholderia cepacia]|nr:hypothetical protein CSX04_08052 [Burkholderia cepacia]